MFPFTDLCLTFEATGAATPSYFGFFATCARPFSKGGPADFLLICMLGWQLLDQRFSKHVIKCIALKMRYAPGIKKSAALQASLRDSTLFIPVPANAGYDLSMKTYALIVVRQPSRMQGKICLWTAGKWAFVAMIRKRKILGCVAPVGFEGSLIRGNEAMALGRHEFRRR